MERIKLNIQKFASGTVYLGVSGNLEGQVVWNSVSNGSAANTSTIYAYLQIRRTNSYTTTGTFSYGWQVGNVASGTQGWYGSISNNWVTITQHTGTIPHDNNGNGYAYIAAWVEGPSGTSLAGKKVSGSQTVTLDKIARFAQITGADDFTDEGTPKVGFTNPANHDLQIQLKVGNTQIVVIDKPAKTSPYTFELTDEQRNQLRQLAKSNTLTVTYVVGSYVSGSIANWSTLNKTMTIVNANPIFNNFTFKDTNSVTTNLTGNNQYNVNGYSNQLIEISTTNKATALKGATMSKYRITIGNNEPVDVEYSDTDTVSGLVNGATSGTINVYAIDSRGNTTLVTKLATKEISFSNITLNALECKLERDNGGVGSNVTLTYKGSAWYGNFGSKSNRIKNATYQLKKTTETEWKTGRTSIIPTFNNDGTFNFSGLIASDNADTKWDLNASYDVRIVIYDELSNIALQLTPLASAIPNISLAHDGVGIMCDYDEQLGGLLQVGGKILDGSYSLEEQKIGTWTNGKPLYKRTIHYDNLPSQANVEITYSTPITEDIIVRYIYGSGEDSRGYNFNLPYVGQNSIQVYYRRFTKQLVFYCINVARNGFFGDITLIYTKPSD